MAVESSVGGCSHDRQQCQRDREQLSIEVARTQVAYTRMMRMELCLQIKWLCNDSMKSGFQKVT